MVWLCQKHDWLGIILFGKIVQKYLNQDNRAFLNDHHSAKQERFPLDSLTATTILL